MELERGRRKLDKELEKGKEESGTWKRREKRRKEVEGA